MQAISRRTMARDKERSFSMQGIGVNVFEEFRMIQNLSLRILYFTRGGLSNKLYVCQLLLEDSIRDDPNQPTKVIYRVYGVASEVYSMLATSNSKG